MVQFSGFSVCPSVGVGPGPLQIALQTSSHEIDNCTQVECRMQGNNVDEYMHLGILWQNADSDDEGHFNLDANSLKSSHSQGHLHRVSTAH